MSVYLITCREIGMVKIGVAFDPFARLKTLQTAFPLDLKVEALIQGSFKLEKELHAQFAVHRVRGEWFRLCPAIESLIDKDNLPQEPRSVAQKRRLQEMHGEPRPKDVLRPPHPTLRPVEAPQLPSWPASRELRRRLASGDIHFPFRSEAA